MSAAASDFGSAALKSQSLCGQNKEASKFRNWDNGCPVKIKTSIAFYWPGLRNFCLSLCILTRIFSHVQLSFQTRGLLCFVLVDVAWLVHSREGCPGDLTHKTGMNSLFRNQIFWFSSCHIFSFQIVSAAAETWSFQWKLFLYFWPSRKLIKAVQYPQCIGKSGAFLTPFSQVGCWVILTHTHTNTHTISKSQKLLHYQIHVLQVWLWVIILVSLKYLCVF